MASKDQPPADERVYDVGSFEAELFWQKNRSSHSYRRGDPAGHSRGPVIWLFSQHSARRAAETLFAEAQDSDAWRALDRETEFDPRRKRHFLLADFRCAHKESWTNPRAS
jgi:hypothetical protein